MNSEPRPAQWPPNGPHQPETGAAYRPASPSGEASSAASGPSASGAGKPPLESAPPPIKRGRTGRLEAPRSCQRILIVGTDELACRLANELGRHFPHDFHLVGFVADRAEMGAQSDQKGDDSTTGPVWGTREELSILVRRHRIDRVMFSNCVDWQLENTGLQRRAPLDHRADAMRAESRRSESRESDSRNGESRDGAPAGDGEAFDPSRRERRREVADLYDWASSSAFFAPDARRARFYESGKRAFDIAFSLGALAAAAPLALLVLPLVKWSSPGPVFYAQERIGRGGAPFTIWKVRTMTQGAETHSGPMLSPHGDTRLTPLGKVLRATKIDEMPQFWNVLRGEMSVVGPRPERPHFVDPFNSHIYSYALRHSVRPGLTGLAQIKGDHLTHVYIKLHYDLIYVCHRTLGLDLMLLLRTPATILRGLLGRA